MPEPVSISLSVLSGALLFKLLGPSADLLGTGFRDFLNSQGREILERILINAANKTGKNIDDNSGVHPRILKEIVLDGALNDDPISIEYFGGLLSSSREKQLTDRLIPMIKLIESLSSDQKRAHFITYKIIHGYYRKVGQPIDIFAIPLALRSFFIDFADFFENMNSNAVPNRENLLTIEHCMHGLFSHNLIEPYQFGDIDYLRKNVSIHIDKPGIVLQPTQLGVQLMMNVHGIKDKIPSEFIGCDLPPAEGVYFKANGQSQPVVKFQSHQG